MNSPRERQQPNEQNPEERALEALIVAALRQQDARGMTFERLLAFENDLTREDREAIDSLGPDLIDRVLSRERAASTHGSAHSEEPVGRRGAVRASGVGRGPTTRRTSEHSPSKGARVMKSLVLSVLVISGLTGAIVFGTRGGGDPARGSALHQEAVDVLAGRLASIEQRLSQLDDLRSRVDRIASRITAAETSSRGTSADSVPAAVDTETGAGTGESGDLRDYIVRVMDEVREEKLAEQRRQLEERQREIAALHEGPYGEYNFRINTMARRLDLSDRQKEHYHLNLVEYNQLIAQSRERESLDQENRQQYRDERKRLRSEFSQVILSGLTPQQAEIFSNLSSNEQRPDGGAGYVRTTSLRIATPPTSITGEPFFDFITNGEALEFGDAITVEQVMEEQVAAERVAAERVAAEQALVEAQRAALEEARAKARAAELEALKAREKAEEVGNEK